MNKRACYLLGYLPDSRGDTAIGELCMTIVGQVSKTRRLDSYGKVEFPALALFGKN